MSTERGPDWRALSSTWSDRLFDLVVNASAAVVLILVLYPLYFVVIASVSEPEAVNAGRMLFWPIGFTLEGYTQILADARVWHAYLNSMLYTTTGTVFGILSTTLAGYALSRRELPARRHITRLMVFTMFFSSGLIPTYLTVRALGLINTRFIVIVMGSISVFNIIIARTFYQQNVPLELYDAGQVDGAGDGRFFFVVALPLSQALLAVLAIYYGVAHWNAFFVPLIYLNDEHLYPLQLILKDILVANETLAQSADVLDLDPSERLRLQRAARLIRYGMIIVSSLPVVMIYPFAQRYFVKGALIGAVKS